MSDSDSLNVHAGKFGTCCKDLKDALELQRPSFFVETNGVLYLTVGMVTTPEGTGYFDCAAFYCPFCGTRLQDRDHVASVAHM